jgi:pimeloyl-ACP methyl ester carboxylesterase
MIGANKLERFTLPLTVGATDVEIAGLHRDGIGTPLVFLHGFGSTKEDYADVVQQEQLADRPVLAYDAPGCGATTCSDLTALSIPSWSPSPNRCCARSGSSAITSSGTRWVG